MISRDALPLSLGDDKMMLNSPHQVEFRSIKQLLNRLNANRETEKDMLISVDSFDLPTWQRQLVWTLEDMGLLIYSIIQNYPIGMIVLWKKKDGVRVPIDGRQRLTAIREFAIGRVAIPSLRTVPDEFKNAKYALLEGDKERDFKELDMQHREIFDDYEPSIVQYDDIDEPRAMDIFVRLQGGKSLTKTEVRAALGGKLCDFVSELTSEPRMEIEDFEEDDLPSQHPFFRDINIRNTRKAHRNLCDVLLHEFLYPRQDKHWSSLETMYLDKSATLTEDEQMKFRSILGRFHRSVRIAEAGTVHPHLRSTFLILSYFRAWREVTEGYALPKDFSFLDIVRSFETQRAENSEETPWIAFNAALSNAGYAQNRIETRHRILINYILRQYPELIPRDERRLFTEAQKIVIWDRANGQCEWEENGRRCQERFPNFREAEADHIVKWIDGGPTSVDNGRLLCTRHNRAPRD